ncbi:MAG: tyrosine-type recombinase/integrase [Actinomycetota bacterium]|nr:tyrosine-type recombinase/integrase [Actinomycetota bacterium]
MYSQPKWPRFLYVFGAATPHRHANWYRRTFRPAVERLVRDGTWSEDLRRLRFHDLRHTCPAILIANGEHPKAVQDRLGHSSITVAMDRCGKLYPGADSALADRLDATYAGTEPRGRGNRLVG